MKTLKNGEKWKRLQRRLDRDYPEIRFVLVGILQEERGKATLCSPEFNIVAEYKFKERDPESLASVIRKFVCEELKPHLASVKKRIDLAVELLVTIKGEEDSNHYRLCDIRLDT